MLFLWVRLWVPSENVTLNMKVPLITLTDLIVLILNPPFAIHSINNPIPIHFERKGLRLDLLKSSEIKLALSNNCNNLNNQQEVNKNTMIDYIL